MYHSHTALTTILLPRDYNLILDMNEAGDGLVVVRSLKDVHGSLMRHKQRYDPTFVEPHAAAFEVPDSDLRLFIDSLKRIQDVAPDSRYSQIHDTFFQKSVPFAFGRFNRTIGWVRPVRLNYDDYEIREDETRLLDEEVKTVNNADSKFVLLHTAISQAPREREPELLESLSPVAAKLDPVLPLLTMPYDFYYGALWKPLVHAIRHTHGEVTTGWDDYRYILELIQGAMAHAYGIDTVLFQTTNANEQAKYDPRRLPDWWNKPDRGEIVVNDPDAYLKSLETSIKGRSRVLLA